MTKVGLDAIGTSTTPESNKSQENLRQNRFSHVHDVFTLLQTARN